MKIQCDYCGNTYEDTQEKCPSCGAPNPSHQNTGKPKTIEELKDWYKKRNLPAPEVTRFFIGQDYKKPKAFGIYKDESTGDFIVYKNKADGTRAVRYQGKDEQYAVNELYQRLKDEIVHQKHLNSEKKSGTRSSGKGRKKQSKLSLLISEFFFWFWIIAFIAAFVGSLIIVPIKNRHNGYYQYDSAILYNYQGDWFYWDDNEWERYGYFDDTTIPTAIESNYDEYYMSKDWNNSYYVGDWDDSSYYDYYHSTSDSDSDSDYDWGSDDSWDSGGTDWDSDW
ncbi:hypothetical protein D6855_01935 [Butyrivibrio sp. CB08]|uniref:hypothetical protein n=1 Tax=Butyrivibrio sp. CB08 TaxID=2364879 RepID=UPI000EA8C584|nr:hypothetical protein [Butyrivibrio sp. CB08]RKM62206.1 hypothetical protein D6855_01935 [Butyrivibrio sp. CB08]